MTPKTLQIFLKRMQARVAFNLNLQLFSLGEPTSSLTRENGPGYVCTTTTVLRMLWRIKIIHSLCFA